MEPSYKTINKQLNKIDKKISAVNHSEYGYIKDNFKKLIWYNFLIGLARGFGMAVGFTVLGAVALYILQKIVMLNLPLISEWIANLIRLAQSYK
ncbi:hypothetical protein Q428_12130 [Fervidicella metallireducens AeB]|uniref:Uncharacterized protein n=1 Tax=Fervidicella metallireducens AeB TaxID=1403537 RepID=A0A017RST4_9CLOT|nr:DUF5665 domain-containing protein [Fervidicella metallireducens]EYE87656.1 hypothetical protein Q428_12130 [Fervidicella metallireducens AeB]